MISSYRDLVEKYDQDNKIIHIKKKVSSEYEAAALMKKTQGKIPMIFEKIDNYKCKMACGLAGTRKLLAESMGIKENEIISHFTKAIVNPIPVTRVNTGPVHENIIEAPFELDRYFPILKHCEKDAGRFLISGIMTAKNVSGKKIYTSIRRMQYLGGNKCTVLITSKEMKEQFEYYKKNRQPMDVAIMFGVVPAVILGSQISTHLFNKNKLDVTGALLGKSLEVVHGKTVDIDVLSEAEVVIEGRVKPWIEETEGPYGEMAGYYGNISKQPIIEFTALTFRNNPLYQTIFSSGHEEKIAMAIAREVVLLSLLRQTVPNVLEVHITFGGAGRLHSIIKIKKINPGDGRQAALAAFASDKDLKHVVVVDDDIDIFDLEEVEWAIATRVQADKDVFIISGANGSPLEPSHNVNNITAKMAIDATCPLGNKIFERTHIPYENDVDLNDYI